jgi:hypothetical protein
MTSIFPTQARAPRKHSPRRRQRHHYEHPKGHVQVQSGRPYTTHVAWEQIRRLCLSATEGNLDDVLARIADCVRRAHAEMKPQIYAKARIGRAEVQRVGRMVANVRISATDLTCDWGMQDVVPSRLLNNIGFNLPGAEHAELLRLCESPVGGDGDCR